MPEAAGRFRAGVARFMLRRRDAPHDEAESASQRAHARLARYAPRQASSPLFFVEARGAPVFSPSRFPLRGKRSAEKRGGFAQASDGRPAKAARDTLARRVAPACDRGSAPLGAPPAAFSGTGRAFGGRQAWHTHHQPAPGGGVLVPPGRSPAPPERGGCVSPARGRRVRLHHRDASRRRPQPSRTEGL